MIIFHTSQKIIDFQSKKFEGYSFKFPESGLHRTQHEKLVKTYLDLHAQGETVNIVTHSGYLFWSLLAEGLKTYSLKRTELYICYYITHDIFEKFHLGPRFEMSGLMLNVWDSGGKYQQEVYHTYGIGKTDKITKVFE